MRNTCWKRVKTTVDTELFTKEDRELWCLGARAEWGLRRQWNYSELIKNQGPQWQKHKGEFCNMSGLRYARISTGRLASIYSNNGGPGPGLRAKELFMSITGPPTRHSAWTWPRHSYCMSFPSSRKLGDSAWDIVIYSLKPPMWFYTNWFKKTCCLN